MTQIRKIIKGNSKLKSYTVREILETMENVVKIQLGDVALTTETSPLQKNILNAFGLNVPK
jgi:hypothetical protein